MRLKKELLVKGGKGILLWGFCSLLFFSLLCFRPQTPPFPSVRSASVSPTPVSFRLRIPRLQIEAPIVLNVPGNDRKKYFQALERGVAHLQGTPLPGEKGNSFIFGHSSFYRNAPGEYKTVFRRLNLLREGDKIEVIVRYKNPISQQTFIFVVKEKKLVSPQDLSALKQTDFPSLTLMTCWPPGTTKYRLLIKATLQR